MMGEGKCHNRIVLGNNQARRYECAVDNFHSDILVDWIVQVIKVIQLFSTFLDPVSCFMFQTHMHTAAVAETCVVPALFTPPDVV